MLFYTLNKFQTGVSLTALFALSACATTQPVESVPIQLPSSDVEISSPLPDAGPQGSSSAGQRVSQTTPQVSGPLVQTPRQGTTIYDLNRDPVFENVSGFDVLSHWSGNNPLPALKAFRRTCALWDLRDSSRSVSASASEYGTYQDWEQACFTSDYILDDPASARSFFETYFRPVKISAQGGESGLLTGYYEPEISVRRRPDAQYYEPILAVPSNGSAKFLPRSEISAATSAVIAYGRPIDVFFMQVQGSGRLVFDDGTRQRAAFAAHNNRPYTSIGKVLVERGEMSLDEASKQSIEAWMNAHSRSQVRALMAENERYVFFRTEDIKYGEGPKGAIGLPLEAMGSLAIDPGYHPYGALIWLETTLPQSGGDYTGAQTGLLVSAQDTGGAIKGALRGDLFFGSGDLAGDYAGVMKHKASWTFLLPTTLATQYLVQGDQYAILDRQYVDKP